MDFNYSPLEIVAGLGCVVALVETALLVFINNYAGDHVKEVLKAALVYKSYAMGAVIQPDGRLTLRAAQCDDSIPDQWKIPRGSIWDEKRLEEGTQLNGPDRMDYGFWTAEGATSINMLEKSQSELFGTSAYITKIGDLKKAEGYIEGHEASNRTGFENFFKEYWPILLGILILVGIGMYVMWDKAVTGPAAWQEVNKCKDEKTNIIAQCGKYIDFSQQFNQTQSVTTTLPPQTNTGAVIVSS
jgi:hypothetical protein